MDPTYVALVPYEADSPLDPAKLLNVAAALQTQLTDDLGPVWGVAGFVSPFPKLEYVPPGYLPLVIVNQDLPGDHHGFHFAMGGLPFALIRYSETLEEWSVPASHELLEMVCDPFGTRTVLGPSLADEKHDALKDQDPSTADSLVVDGEDTYARQGQVEYLVEVCDPCEQSTYEINGVTVSDFVTPAYYGVAVTPGALYSRTGAIEHPRQLLADGDISWRTRLSQSIFQASLEDGAGSANTNPTQPSDKSGGKAGSAAAKLKIARLGDVPSKLSREAIHSPVQGTPGQRTHAGASSSGSTGEPGPDFAEAFRSDVNDLIGWLEQAPQRPVTVQDVIDLLRELDPKGGDKVDDGLLKKHNIVVTPNGKHRVKADYKRILEVLEEQKKVSGLFGPDLFDPNLALWLCMLTN
jgi:hypothetical protein